MGLDRGDQRGGGSPATGRASVQRHVCRFLRVAACKTGRRPGAQAGGTVTNALTGLPGGDSDGRVCAPLRSGARRSERRITRARTTSSRRLVASLTSLRVGGLKPGGERADRKPVECVGRSFSDDRRSRVAVPASYNGTVPGVDPVERPDQPERTSPGRPHRLVVRRGPVRGLDDSGCCVAGFGQLGWAISIDDQRLRMCGVLGSCGWHSRLARSGVSGERQRQRVRSRPGPKHWRSPGSAHRPGRWKRPGQQFGGGATGAGRPRRRPPAERGGFARAGRPAWTPGQWTRCVTSACRRSGSCG